MSLRKMNPVPFILLGLLCSFAAGRWLAPEKVRIETKTVEIEKKDSASKTEQDRNRRKETTETKVTKPDGSVEETRKIIEETETSKKTDKRDTSESASSEETLKEVTRSSAKVTIAALMGVPLAGNAPPVLYGGSVSKPILGPITVGVFYLTSPAIGGMLGLTF